MANTVVDLRPSPLLKLVVCFTVLVLGLLYALQGWQAWNAYDDAREEAATRASNLSRALAQHAGDAIKELDLLTANAVEQLEFTGLEQLDNNRLHNQFKTQVKILPQLHGLFVYDAAGRWLVTDKDKIPDGANNGDREYFQYHRNNPDPGLHIGPVIQSRSTGDLIIPVSRRINRPDGSFAGVFLATINLEYFNRYYSDFQLEPDSVMVLALADGTLLFRRPYDQAQLGASLARGVLFTQYLPLADSGTALVRSVIDNTLRLYSYRRIERYPLVVEVGIAREAVFGPWWANLRHTLMLLILASAGLLAMALVIIRQLRHTLRTDEQLRRTQATLQTLVMQDSLTGLANRRSLDTELEMEFGRARRNGQPLSLVMIDIDHFKRFNDLYGHPAGDRCIQAVSQTIAGSLHRPGDLAARYGGEEMLVILPNTDMIGAQRVAEGILQNLRDLQIPHQGSDRQIVTISAGIATHDPKRASYATPEALVRASDEALYLAKRNGRDQVATRYALPSMDKA